MVVAFTETVRACGAVQLKTQLPGHLLNRVSDPAWCAMPPKMLTEGPGQGIQNATQYFNVNGLGILRSR
jgi:hypothetical protein